MRGANPTAWEVGVPKYIHKHFPEHQALDRMWRWAVEDQRNKDRWDPVVCWCRTAKQARLVADALNGRKP